ncbi:MAG: Hsp20/alpha crystallin family protein [Patescibacteria group bacterium]
MALIKWSPFFFEPFEDFDKAFEGIGMPSRGGTSIIPPVDMYETKDAVVVEMPLAGVDPNKVEVSLADNILTIKGSSERKTEVDEKDYYRREMRSGSVFRQIQIPKRVKETDIEATFDNGILRVTLPKQAEGGQAVKVTVKQK